jgi:hypothetical protein
MSQTIVFRNVSLSSHLSWGNASGLRQEHSEELWWAAGTLLVSSTSRPGAESLESGSAHKVKMHQISSRQKEIIVFPFSSIGDQWSPMSLIIPSWSFMYFQVFFVFFNLVLIWIMFDLWLSINYLSLYLELIFWSQPPGRADFLGQYFPQVGESIIRWDESKIYRYKHLLYL